MIEITKDRLTKIGIPGLLAMGLIATFNWNMQLQGQVEDLHEDIRELRADLREERKANNEFVNMVAERYLIPLTQ